MYGGTAPLSAARVAGYAGGVCAERKLSQAVEMVLIAAIAAASLALWRARSKFGIAIAANRDMIATTIMISTSVKPCLLLNLSMSILLSSQ